MDDQIKKLLGSVLNLDPESIDFGKKSIPGTISVPGREFYYVGSVSRERFEGGVFRELLNVAVDVEPQTGGIIANGCEIETPDGMNFQSVSFKGDLDAWRRKIIAGAEALELTVARIEDGAFIRSNGVSVPLDACKIAYY
jgi:hypothetical protein